MAWRIKGWRWGEVLTCARRSSAHTGRLSDLATSPTSRQSFWRSLSKAMNFPSLFRGRLAIINLGQEFGDSFGGKVQVMEPGQI